MSAIHKLPWGLLAWLMACAGVFIISPNTGVILGLMGVAVWSIRPRQKRRLRRIADSRPAIQFEQFLGQLGHTDVDPDIARFVWSTLQYSLRDKGDPDFPLDPDDDLENDLLIDPDDIHLDLFRNAINSFGLDDTDTTCQANPYYDGSNTARNVIHFFSVQPKK